MRTKIVNAATVLTEQRHTRTGASRVLSVLETLGIDFFEAQAGRGPSYWIRESDAPLLANAHVGRRNRGNKDIETEPLPVVLDDEPTEFISPPSAEGRESLREEFEARIRELRAEFVSQTEFAAFKVSFKELEEIVLGDRSPPPAPPPTPPVRPSSQPPVQIKIPEPPPKAPRKTVLVVGGDERIWSRGWFEGLPEANYRHIEGGGAAWGHRVPLKQLGHPDFVVLLTEWCGHTADAAVKALGVPFRRIGKPQARDHMRTAIVDFLEGRIVK